MEHSVEPLFGEGDIIRCSPYYMQQISVFSGGGVGFGSLCFLLRPLAEDFKLGAGAEVVGVLESTLSCIVFTFS